MPVTLGLVSAGLQGVGGLAQIFGSDKDQKQADLERLAKNSPLYTPSKSINDYYQKALNRYQENPYQSAQYIAGQQAAQRATASGISALQDRRSAIGGLPGLVKMQTNQMGLLAQQAEARKAQEFNQLGQASQLQAGEQAKAFDINQMTPYNRQLQLKQYAAQAANDRYNAGLQMLGGAATNAAQLGSSYLAANPKVATTPLTQAQSNLASQKAFDTARSYLPTLDTSLIPKTTGLPKRNPYISPASVYFPSAY